jgi:hypothetical protein
MHYNRKIRYFTFNFSGAALYEFPSILFIFCVFAARGRHPNKSVRIYVCVCVCVCVFQII